MTKPRFGDQEFAILFEKWWIQGGGIGDDIETLRRVSKAKGMTFPQLLRLIVRTALNQAIYNEQ